MLRKVIHNVPTQWRRSARRALRELPCRVRDFVPDLRDRLSKRETPLPPAKLRERASLSSDRSEFLRVGIEGQAAIRVAFEQTRERTESYPCWLDFGCGSGRLSRHLKDSGHVQQWWGVDVDSEAVAWAHRNLEGRFLAIASAPPTSLPSNFFDIVVAVSVFSHFSAESQWKWLNELHRVLRPGGRLIATTHSPALTFTRPDLTASQHEGLRDTGFLFAPGRGSFNEDSAFHSREYLMQTWGKLLGLLLFRNQGMTGYQDMSVWVKW